MTRNIKKFLATIFAGCLLLTSITHADYNNDSCCSCNPCECAPECFCRFPNYSPCCTGMGDGFTFTGEFLWWKPCFSDLSWALKFDQDVNSPGTTFSSCGNFLEINHEWVPGIRVGMEIENIWCNWDLIVNYTWITGKIIKDADNNSGTLVTTLIHPDFTNNLGFPLTVNAYHRYRYQTFDIVLGQDYCITPCHYFVPYFGFQGVKLNQVWHTLAVNGVESNTLRWDSCYEALGLELGIDYHYAFNSCLEFYTDAKFSVVGGCNVGRNEQVNVNQEESLVTTTWTFRTDDAICTPGIHLRAGINYTLCSCGREFLFTIGYEFLDWYNMPQIRRFPQNANNDLQLSTSPNGSRIGFHGLMVGLGFSI